MKKEQKRNGDQSREAAVSKKRKIKKAPGQLAPRRGGPRRPKGKAGDRENVGDNFAFVKKKKIDESRKL